MHIHMYIHISVNQSDTISTAGFWNVVYSVHRLLLGSACRNLADRLADMDVIQGNVKEKNGLSIYNYRYQVDVYIHIYFQEGQHSPRGAWATPLN